MDEDFARLVLNYAEAAAFTRADQHEPSEAEWEMAAAEVMWVMHGDREVGMEPGGFVTNLIKTVSLADQANALRLHRGFPTIVACVIVYKEHPEGVTLLRALAGSREKGN